MTSHPDFQNLEHQRARLAKAIAVFPVTEQERIRAALAFAERAHEGQERKGGIAIPYIVHPIRVACALIEEMGIAAFAQHRGPSASDAVIAALLHDVVEDCEVNIGEIGKRFGSVVEELVAWLTWESGRDAKWAQAKRMQKAPFAVRAVKAADITDNARDFSMVPSVERRVVLRSIYGYERWGRDIIQTLGPEHIARLDAALDAIRATHFSDDVAPALQANEGKEIVVQMAGCSPVSPPPARRGRPRGGGIESGSHALMIGKQCHPPSPPLRDGGGETDTCPSHATLVARYPIRTPLVTPQTNLLALIQQHAVPHLRPGDLLAISERIVAITQGRAYRIEDIHPSWWARFLVRFVHKSPYGIGLGSPWTMELAIREAGVPRILLGCIVTVITKPLGIKGMFYRVVGHNVNAIDGPCDYTLRVPFSPPLLEGETKRGCSDRYAKLGPKDPDRVAIGLAHEVGVDVAIIDANDLGVTVLGASEGVDRSFVRAAFRDNPLGQSKEQTPMAIVRQAASQQPQATSRNA